MIIRQEGDTAFRDKTTKTDGRGGEKRERGQKGWQYRGTTRGRSGGSGGGGGGGWGLGGGGGGRLGVLIETRTKASGGRAAGQRRRRRVEGTEVRRRGALLLPVI